MERKVLAVLGAIALALALLAFVIYVPRLSFIGPGGHLTAVERAKAESDLRGNLVTALGGLVLAAGAYFTGRTFALNREGQITERFTRAVEQLGEGEEKLDIRLGGIYALERIARDSKTHYEPVMEVLTAFLRQHARKRPKSFFPDFPLESSAEMPPEPYKQGPEALELRVDFQAAAMVVGRRDRRHERAGYHLDLRVVALQRANLSGAHLSEANLLKADLSGADLFGADLSGADLSRADLSLAYLGGANFTGAYLSGADLSWAHLVQADLTEADLTEADLSRADLSGADLSGANLSGANLSVDHSGNIAAATGLTPEQLATAITDDATQLPAYVLPKAGG